MPNQINNARLRRRRAEREPITMKALLPFLLTFLVTLLVPARKLLEGLLNRKVAPLIRHGLGMAGGALAAKGFLDAGQAAQVADLTDLVMAFLLGALAIGWSYAEKWAIAKAGGTDPEKIPRAIPVPPVNLLLLLLLLLVLPSCETLREKGVGISFSIGTQGLCLKPVFGTHADPEVTEGEPAFVNPAIVVPSK